MYHLIWSLPQTCEAGILFIIITPIYKFMKLKRWNHFSKMTNLLNASDQDLDLDISGSEPGLNFYQYDINNYHHSLSLP